MMSFNPEKRPFAEELVKDSVFDSIRVDAERNEFRKISVNSQINFEPPAKGFKESVKKNDSIFTQ